MIKLVVVGNAWLVTNRPPSLWGHGSHTHLNHLHNINGIYVKGKRSNEANIKTDYMVINGKHKVFGCNPANNVTRHLFW